MSPTFTFKPIQASLVRNTEIIGKMAPYCVFKVGNQTFKGQVCRNGGKQPTWNDSVTIPMTDFPTCLVKIKDRDLIKDDEIGSFEVDLHEIEAEGKAKKWYSLYHKDKPAGQILMEVSFNASSIKQMKQSITRQSSADFSILSEAEPNIPCGKASSHGPIPNAMPKAALPALISSVRQANGYGCLQNSAKSSYLKFERRSSGIVGAKNLKETGLLVSKAYRL